MNDILKRTPINALAIPTFDRFIIDTNEKMSEDVLHIFAMDGSTLLGIAKRLPKYRGKISRQWNVTGFSRHGSFVYDFEQIEKIVNEYLDNR
jgi:hypothetical protein